MKILHISAHMGGGVGKALVGLAEECSKIPEVNQRILLLESPEKTISIDRCRRNHIDVTEYDKKQNISDIIEWADIVVISWWNHPLMSQFLSECMKTKCRCVLWTHINGCSYPYLPYDLAVLPERLLITTKYSMENPLWNEEQRKHIKSKTHLISGIGNFNPCEVVPKPDYNFKDKFVIGYAGTINFAKMNPKYFEYCKYIKEKIPEAHFLLIGEPDNEIKKKISELGLQDSVTLTGYVEDVYTYYRRMDVMGYLLNENNYATTENVILEAMASGVPVIAFNNGPESYIIENNKTGILINNKEEYACQIAKLKESAEFRERLGKSGREYVINDYSAKNNCAEFINIMNDVIKSEKRMYDFSDIIGTVPYEWFCAFTGKDKKRFENIDRMSSGELQNFLYNISPIYKVQTKSSIYHFAKYYSEEAEFKKLMKEMEKAGNFTPGGVRQPLGKVLPLNMPYLIQIFPAYACNFRCGYCIHSLDKAEHGYISDEVLMPMDRYKKVIDDIKETGQKIKMLRFAAIGEPLIHPQIADMVAYAKKADVAESIDIVTNGALLTPELSDKLVEAGLSKLRISLEGLSSEDYMKNSSAKISFDEFVENIRYFYNHCKDTKMYIKIIDYMVQEKEKQEKFFSIFSPITHDIAIEHLTPTIQEIDYDKISGGMKTDKPQNGEKLQNSKICPQPFYMMQVNPDGNVVSCCSMKYPCVLGNVDKNSVYEIWHGDPYNAFRKKLLKGVQTANKVCSECTLYLYDMHEEDRLDEYSEELFKKY